MENFQGDLTDIFRASGESHHNNTTVNNISSSWEFQSDHLNLTSSSSSHHTNHFGDPFCNITDPLLHLHQPPCYSSDHILASTSPTVVENQIISGANSINNSSKIVVEDHEMNKVSPCDIFSRIQISHSKTPLDSSLLVAAAPTSSNSSPPPARGFKAAQMVSIDVMNMNTSKSCLIDNTGSLQISSPRNLGIKRRKSQAKKVVCIPAPAAANSRPSGEVVPSDLWAWRKYGQKPIKGSPYPRGYYRCSSSKGCSARKQVERSRTDPNMLVITYTSEHNHPWPTQRNALAGSTRSQPPKAAKSTSLHHLTKTKEEDIDQDSLLSPDHDLTMPNSATTAPLVCKEENVDDFETNMDIIDDQLIHHNNHQNSYRPTLPDSNHNQPEDFFAELGEIEADPLRLLFGQADPHRDRKQSKGLDPFTLFDWSGSEENNHNNISNGQDNKGL
ncbi:WRKY DNA-binding protein 14 [Euphorbia peplus]|nr:WRKY DNA-binding protein 14 [Euphorbia peplus]